MPKKPSVWNKYRAKKDRLEITIKHYEEKVRAQRSDEAPPTLAWRQSRPRKSKSKEGQERQVAKNSLEGNQIACGRRLIMFGEPWGFRRKGYAAPGWRFHAMSDTPTPLNAILVVSHLPRPNGLACVPLPQQVAGGRHWITPPRSMRSAARTRPRTNWWSWMCQPADLSPRAIGRKQPSGSTNQCRR